jgi:hypothetical protein
MTAPCSPRAATGATMAGIRARAIEHRRTAMRLGCAAAAFMLLAGPASAQAPAELQAQSDVTSPQPKSTPPANRPGFIDAFGHWIESSVSDWNAGLKGAADVAKDAADAATTVTRDTAGAVVRFPGTRVIAERATCPTAPNGAPDCRAAAEAICKAHGFAEGRSIDFQTAEKCPPIALNRPDAEPPRCVIESYVTRALCQ